MKSKIPNSWKINYYLENRVHISHTVEIKESFWYSEFYVKPILAANWEVHSSEFSTFRIKEVSSIKLQNCQTWFHVKSEYHKNSWISTLHPYFTWNQYWWFYTLKNCKLCFDNFTVSNYDGCAKWHFLRFWKWFHVKSEWHRNSSISTLYSYLTF